MPCIASAHPQSPYPRTGYLFQNASRLFLRRCKTPDILKIILKIILPMLRKEENFARKHLKATPKTAPC
jgi:hypothetical protein